MSEKNEKKKKPAKAALAVVPKLPIKAGAGYREFDDYAKAARHMLERIDAIDAGNTCSDDLEYWYKKFAAGRKKFERDELYEECEDSEGFVLRQISRRVVTEKIGLLIGSFPNAGPHNPETYIGMLTQEILAANPYVSALEAACRELRRTKNFPPSIAEMLEELGKQEDDTWPWALEIQEKNIESWVQKRTGLIEAAEAKAAKAAEKKREEAIRSARQEFEKFIRWKEECVQGIEAAKAAAEAAAEAAANEIEFAKEHMNEAAVVEAEAEARAAQAKIAARIERLIHDLAIWENSRAHAYASLKALATEEELAEIAAPAKIKTNGAGSAELLAPTSTSE